MCTIAPPLPVLRITCRAVRGQVEGNMTRSIVAHLRAAVRLRKARELQADAFFTRWTKRCCPVNVTRSFGVLIKMSGIAFC